MSGASSANHPIVAHDGQPGAVDHDSRLLLEPYGDTFTNQSIAAKTITDIFYSRFCGAFVSWKKVPPEVKEMWWLEFKNKYRWEQSHEGAIKRAWNLRCQDRMKDMLYNVRNRKKRPNWMSEPIYKELEEIWGSEAYAKKSKQMSVNRRLCNEGKGVGKHTGGSLSFPEHESRMRLEKGDSYEYHELWDSLHMVHKDGPNKGQFIDQKATHTRARFDEIVQQQSGASSTSSCNIDEKTIFAEAAGGMKKGHVYGLGSESKRLKSLARTSSSSQASQASQASQVQSHSMEAMQEQINALQQQVASKEAMQEQINALQQQVATKDEQILNLQRGQEQILQSLQQMQQWTLRSTPPDWTEDQ